MAFRREAFEHGAAFSLDTGYRRGYLSEDVEFSLRVKKLSGKKLPYLPDMKVLNKVYSYRLSTRFIIARSSWIGYSRRNIARNGGSKQLETENLLVTSLLKTLSQVNRHGYGGNFFKRTNIVLLSAFSLGFRYILEHWFDLSLTK